MCPFVRHNQLAAPKRTRHPNSTKAGSFYSNYAAACSTRLSHSRLNGECSTTPHESCHLELILWLPVVPSHHLPWRKAGQVSWLPYRMSLLPWLRKACALLFKMCSSRTALRQVTLKRWPRQLASTLPLGSPVSWLSHRYLYTNSRARFLHRNNCGAWLPLPTQGNLRLILCTALSVGAPPPSA